MMAYVFFASSHIKQLLSCPLEPGLTPFQTYYCEKISRMSPGIEPGTSCMVVRHTNHCTTEVIVMLFAFILGIC